MIMQTTLPTTNRVEVKIAACHPAKNTEKYILNDITKSYQLKKQCQKSGHKTIPEYNHNSKTNQSNQSKTTSPKQKQ